MAHLTGKARADYVQNMFGRIARQYNLLNRIITLGQDMKWRRFVVKQARIPPGGTALDLATGTGDIAFAALKSDPAARMIGADFALPMMRVGQKLDQHDRVRWCGADALALPFPDEQFDAVVSGYLMRNVVDMPRALAEQYRVLKPGGRIVILETSPPPDNILRPLILIHLKYIIPMLGRIIGGKAAADAYRYLPKSTQTFKTPAELVLLMNEAGFNAVDYKLFMLGTMAIHWGEKAL